MLAFLLAGCGSPWSPGVEAATDTGIDDLETGACGLRRHAKGPTFGTFTASWYDEGDGRHGISAGGHTDSCALRDGRGCMTLTPVDGGETLTFDVELLWIDEWDEAETCGEGCGYAAGATGVVAADEIDRSTSWSVTLGLVDNGRRAGEVRSTTLPAETSGR